MELTTEVLTDLYIIGTVKGFGPQKFRALHDAGVAPGDVLATPGLLPIEGKIGNSLRHQIARISPETLSQCRVRAVRQVEAAKRAGATILTYNQELYPHHLLESNYAIPILFVRGNPAVLLSRRAVSCVGSRRIRSQYEYRHRSFVRTASGAGFVVVSGFALGADTAGHREAQSCGGQTICVMPGGLDRPFPPENHALWNQLLKYDEAAFVSEFPFGTPATALTLKRRNKIIVALALGVLVSQSATCGGAMNAYRFAIQQKKSVATFEADGTDDTSGNAEIQRESRWENIVFPLARDQPEGYAQWLSQMSSSVSSSAVA